MNWQAHRHAAPKLFANNKGLLAMTALLGGRSLHVCSARYLHSE